MSQHTGLPSDVLANIDHIKRIRNKIDALEQTYLDSVDALTASVSRHVWSIDEAVELDDALPDGGSGFRFMTDVFAATRWSRQKIRMIVKERQLKREQGNQYLPMDGTPCVYVLRLHGVTVYVGRSINVKARMKFHRRNGNTFDSYEVYVCESEKEMIDLEAVLIQQYRPIRNRRIERRTA